MATHFISKAEAAKILFDYSEGSIFTVKFIKRSDNTLRTMNCRKGVKKGVTGVGFKFNPKARNLVPVYDMQIAAKLKKTGETDKKAFRMISVEGITEMTMNGTCFVVR